MTEIKRIRRCLCFLSCLSGLPLFNNCFQLPESSVGRLSLTISSKEVGGHALALLLRFFRNQKYPLCLTTAVPGGLTETQCIVVFLYHVQMLRCTTRKLYLGWMVAELILLLGGKMKPFLIIMEEGDKLNWSLFHVSLMTNFLCTITWIMIQPTSIKSFPGPILL